MAGNKCGQLALIKTLKEHKTSISELEGIERALGMTIGQQRTDTELMRILAELGRIHGFNIGLIIIDAISGVQKANSVISKISVNPTTCIVINHVGDAYSGHYEPITDESTIIAHNFHSLNLQSDTGSESSSNPDEVELALAISASLGQKCHFPDEDLELAIAMSESLKLPEKCHYAYEGLELAIAMSESLESPEKSYSDEDLCLAMAMSLSLSA